MDFHQHDQCTEGPHLTLILGLEKKTVFCKIRVSGTVGSPILMQKSPTCTYISQKHGSGNSVSDFRVSAMIQQNFFLANHGH